MLRTRAPPEPHELSALIWLWYGDVCGRSAARGTEHFPRCQRPSAPPRQPGRGTSPRCALPQLRSRPPGRARSRHAAPLRAARVPQTTTPIVPRAAPPHSRRRAPRARPARCMLGVVVLSRLPGRRGAVPRPAVALSPPRVASRLSPPPLSGPLLGRRQGARCCCRSSAVSLRNALAAGLTRRARRRRPPVSCRRLCAAGRKRAGRGAGLRRQVRGVPR